MKRPLVEGYVVQRWTDDGDLLAVAPMSYGKGRIIIGCLECVNDAWCYETLDLAVAAFATWDGQGEPHGWFRHPLSGRRRPDGDPKREHVHR